MHALETVLQLTAACLTMFGARSDLLLLGSWVISKPLLVQIYDLECYMMENPSEYFAEGTQSWFDATARTGACCACLCLPPPSRLLSCLLQ